MVFEGSSNSEILDPVLEKREPGVNWEKAEGGGVGRFCRLSEWQ